MICDPLVMALHFDRPATGVGRTPKRAISFREHGSGTLNRYALEVCSDRAPRTSALLAGINVAPEPFHQPNRFQAPLELPSNGRPRNLQFASLAMLFIAMETRLPPEMLSPCFRSSPDNTSKHADRVIFKQRLIEQTKLACALLRS